MGSANANASLALAFADEIARCGVRHGVICPGSRSTPLALALDRSEDLSTVVLLDERSAGFAALGMAAAAGSAAFVLTTSGTAAANLHPAVSEANESGVPLIVLTADRPPELRGIGAGQTIDQLKLYGTEVRWFCEVGTHDADVNGLLHLRSVATRGVAFATDSARPGPVHLNFAWREPLTPEPGLEPSAAGGGLGASGRNRGRPLTAVTPREQGPPAAAVHSAAELLSGCERGVIVAGRQPAPSLAPALAELSGRTGFPVLAEPTSQVRSTESGQHLISGYDWIARLAPTALRPELVLRFGEFPTSKPLRQWLSAADGIEEIAFFEHGWNDPGARAAAMVRAAPAAAARALAEAIDPGRRPAAESSWTSLWRAAEEAVRAVLASELATGLSEPGLHRALGKLYQEGDLVYTASSMPIRDQESFLPVTAGRVLFLANRGANGIDGLVSSAAGAARASGRRSWALTGDLGLVHDAAGLAALAASDADVRVIVANNDGGAIFEHLPQAERLERAEFERLFITPSGVEIAALAAAYGVDYARIEDLAELAELPDRCLAEVRTDGVADAKLRAAIGAQTRDALVDALALT